MSVLGQVTVNDIKVKPDGISKYTYDDFNLLSDSKNSFKSPLAIIGLIDLNAFFAQVESNRLGLTAKDPVVCVQWRSLIAVSYAAREYGIDRLTTVDEAVKKCPNVVLAHAAVFKKGQSHWAYEEGLPDAATHKVSLDPYRRESRKILKLIQRHVDSVEKASVDECYMDFGQLVHKRAIDLFPQLSEGKGDLPCLPDHMPSNLKSYGNMYGADTVTVEDWDDVLKIIGSELMFEIRQRIYEVLNYTTSGGVGRNKFVAKLAAGVHKPDGQLTVSNKTVYSFMNQFPLTDISSMGGKIGDQVLYKLDVPPDVSSNAFIRDNYTLSDLENQLNDKELAQRVYLLVRGDKKVELKPRVELKSMMSRKNLNNPMVSNLKDAYDWIKVFSGDLHGRLIELDDESMNISSSQEEKDNPVFRRPRTLGVQFQVLGTGSSTKQTAIKMTLNLDKLSETIEKTAIKILKDALDFLPATIKLNNGKKLKDFQEITTKIKIPPINQLSVILSNFENCYQKNMIDEFLTSATPRSPKSIFEEFKQDISANEETGKIGKTTESKSKNKTIDAEDKKYINSLFQNFEKENNRITTEPIKQKKDKYTNSNSNQLEASSQCSKCGEKVDNMAEHRDFHFAQELSASLNGTPINYKTNDGRKKRKINKGQSKLPF